MADLPPSSKLTGVSNGATLARIARPVADLAGERHAVDVGVAGQRLAGAVGPEAVHDVEHARRQAGLQGQLAQPRRRQRRLLGRLEHRRAPERQRRRDLPRGLHEREVPGADAGRDAGRLVADVGVATVVDPRLAVGVRGPVGEEAQVAGAARDVGARLADRLAGVARLEQRERLRVAVDQVGERVQVRSPPLRPERGPDRERGAGGAHGAIDLLGPADRHVGEPRAVVRVVRRERAVRARPDERVADHVVGADGGGYHERPCTSACASPA